MQGLDRLSIIIPTLNATPALGPCLAAIGPDCDVIVSDGGSTDQTRLLARTAGARLITGTPGRGGQLVRGAAASDADWLLFLHADCVLQDDWRSQVAAAMAQPEKAHVFRLRFDAPGMMPRIVAGWANLRTQVFGMPFGDQGLLISRSLYDQVGGYPDIPLMEDLAIARALGRRRIALLPAAVETDATRYLAGGWLRHGARNMVRQVRFLAGADPTTLARDYISR